MKGACPGCLRGREGLPRIGESQVCPLAVHQHSSDRGRDWLARGSEVPFEHPGLAALNHCSQVGEDGLLGVARHAWTGFSTNGRSIKFVVPTSTFHFARRSGPWVKLALVVRVKAFNIRYVLIAGFDF